MEKVQHVIYFFALALVVLGVVGSIGYLTYYGDYLFAIADVVVGIACWPTVGKWYNKMFEL